MVALDGIGAYSCNVQETLVIVYNLCVFLWNWQLSQSDVCSSMEGEVSTLRQFCPYGFTVYGNHLRRVRDVVMKRDYAFVVCILPFNVG